MKSRFILSVVFLFVIQTSFAQLGNELIPNGSFKKLDDKGWVVGWRKAANASIRKDADGSYLYMKGRCNQLSHKIPLKPEYGSLKLSMKMKVEDVVIGDESWETGRLTMCFQDESGKMVGGWPDVFGYVGTTDWLDCEREYAVPKGAAYLSLAATNLGKSGDVMFRDISLKVSRLRAVAPSDVLVPAGVSGDPGSLDDAFRIKTKLREKICMNGLWRFRPVLEGEAEDVVPGEGSSWGWFKVPGVWPNSVSEFNNGVQKLWIDPWIEENVGLKLFDQAWYMRTIEIPSEWKNRRVILDFTMLQTHAQAFVDGKPAGTLWYPGGELDLSGHLIPGKTHILALLVTARPVSKQKLTFMAPDRVFKDKASVRSKGITGDLYLCSMPEKERLEDLQVITSVEKGMITFAAETAGLKQESAYILKAVVDEVGPVSNRTVPIKSGSAGESIFMSMPVKVGPGGKLSFSSKWNNAKLWDTHTPGNMYSVTLQLLAVDGTLIDELTPIEFGFREIRISGRDFLLNEIPVHLRLLFNRSTTEKADVANEATSRTMCRRMFDYGFNALIFGNYDFSPGSVAYIDGLLNACDKEGMLVSCSLPHMKDFDSNVDDPEVAERYRAMTEWLIRRVRNHPSVIMYAMNHNACGYYGDQNPLKIDGKYEIQMDDTEKSKYRKRNRDRAMITDAIAKSIDSTRPVYHHQSGHLGDMHTVNIYLNWAPVQERSEWLRHWSTEGVKPLFFVEWGLPHISSWSSYRGPKFIWRTDAFQSLWAAEYAAQFWGDEAYRDDAVAIKGIDHEERLWAKGEPFRWSTLNAPLRDMTENYTGVQALFANDNWRSHRAWGISAMLPWDQEGIWNRIKDGDTVTVTNSLQNLKQPGIKPDLIGANHRYIYAPDGDENFVPSPLGRSILRWNMPDCAFIGGGDNFTAKAHACSPGECVSRNLVILNDRRTEEIVTWQWRLWLKGEVIKESSGATKLGPGSQVRVPVVFKVPSNLSDGERMNLTAVFNFKDGIVQTDQFGIDLVHAPELPELTKKIYLYDTKGLTAELFDRLKIKYTKFSGSASEVKDLGYSNQPATENADSSTVAGVRDPGSVNKGLDPKTVSAAHMSNPASRIPHLASNSILVIGRESLTKAGLLWMNALPKDVDVIVFEQNASVFEGLLGFRIAERGMRTCFVRYPHAVTDIPGDAGFRDWRGEATLISSFLPDLPQYEEHNPLWQWCGFYNTRVWRSSTGGNVASVVIEKPQRGDWRSLLDCGFDMQYSPLLECVEDGRHIVFCQLDVCGRTQCEPVADRVVVNLLAYLDQAGIKKPKSVQVMGEKAKKLLDELGVISGEASSFARSAGLRRDKSASVPSSNLQASSILVADSSAEPPENLRELISDGLNLLCLGMNAGQLASWSPVPVSGVSTNACFTRIEEIPAELKGLSNADWAWHGRMKYDAVFTGDKKNSYGNNALRVIHYGKGCVIFCQVPPWKIDEEAKPYLRTSKRASYRLVSRILANLGIGYKTSLLERFSKPVENAWLNSYYIDVPVAEDDPYRYYRW